MAAPAHLLTLYDDVHASDHCSAVRVARELLAQGIDPVGRPEMADYSQFVTAQVQGRGFHVQIVLPRCSGLSEKAFAVDKMIYLNYNKAVEDKMTGIHLPETKSYSAANRPTWLDREPGQGSCCAPRVTPARGRCPGY